jgi:hypothetical protein
LNALLGALKTSRDELNGSSERLGGLDRCECAPRSADAARWNVKTLGELEDVEPQSFQRVHPNLDATPASSPELGRASKVGRRAPRSPETYRRDVEELTRVRTRRQRAHPSLNAPQRRAKRLLGARRPTDETSKSSPELGRTSEAGQKAPRSPETHRRDVEELTRA